MVGDKTFTGNDNLQYAGIGTFTPPTAAGITVTGQVSPSGLFGLQFSGGMSVSGNGSLLDILFQYTVTSSGGLITDIHLDFNGGFTGTGHTQVTETIFAANGVTILGQAQVTNPPPAFDQTIFLSSPQSSVIVKKDILLTSGTEGTAFISFVDQFVSQTTTVPEPASLLLLGSGLVALGIAAGRRLFL